MLVPHASSRCDVCLESYGFNTPDEFPHAIPCGHIFCKSCLNSLAPPVVCPLCRKAFLPERAKRLHVDRPPENSLTGTASAEELERLQRLALVSEENAPPDSLVEVMEEVENWLSAQTPDSNKPLRSAWNALRRYQKLKDQHDKDRAKLRDQERQIRHRDRNTVHDRQTAKAVEESLLTRLQEVEDEYATLRACTLLGGSLSATENEVTTLRAELARFRKTSNPLPPPPEPLPLEQLPLFARPLNEPLTSQPASSGSKLQPTESNSRNPNNHIPQNDANADPYVDDQAYFNTNTHAFEPLPPALQADLAKVAEMERSLRKAARIGIPKHQQTSANEYTNTHQFPPTTGDSDHPSNNRHRVGIIPGASPARRIVPPRPRWTDTDINAQTPIGESERAWRERTGNEWNQDQERSRSFENAAVDTMSAARQALRDVLGNGTTTTSTHPRTTVEEVLDPSPFTHAAAYITGYASGYGSGYTLSGGSDLVYGDGHLMDSPDLERGPEYDGLGLYGVTAPSRTGYTRSDPRDFNPTPRPTQLHRRNTTSSMGISEAPGTAARPTYTNPARGNVTPTGSSARADERNSVSSWGTVHTRTALDSNSRRGSLSDLGLIGLHGGGGVRGSGTVVASVPTTPARFGGQSGYRRDTIDQEEIDTDTPEATRSAIYPQTPGAFSSGLPERVHSNMPIDSNGSRRRRHLRSTSHPEPPIQTPDATERQNRRVPRTNRSDRHQNPRRSALTGQQGDTARPPTGNPYDPSSDLNALALSFDQPSDSSFPPHSSSESHPPGVYLNISAPTPIVSTRNIMHSWTVDA